MLYRNLVCSLESWENKRVVGREFYRRRHVKEAVRTTTVRTVIMQNNGNYDLSRANDVI